MELAELFICLGGLTFISAWGDRKSCWVVVWSVRDQYPDLHYAHKMVKYTQKIRWLLPTNCLSVSDHIPGLLLTGFQYSQMTVQHKKYKEIFIYLSYTRVQDKINFEFKFFHSNIVHLMFSFSMSVFDFLC